MCLRIKIIDEFIQGNIGRQGIILRQEVIDYFKNYPKSYTGVILSNSEKETEHSPTYKKFTIRISKGKYKISTQIINRRRKELGI